MDYAEMGRRVRQRRAERGMTQEQLAEKVGISTSFVGHIERAEKTASLETMAAICACLGVDLDWLVFGKRALRCDGAHCAMLKDLKHLIDEYS